MVVVFEHRSRFNVFNAEFTQTFKAVIDYHCHGAFIVVFFGYAYTHHIGDANVLHPYICPNFYMDEFSEFDPEVNDAFRFADCKMFLAYKDGKIAGRIAGISDVRVALVQVENKFEELLFIPFGIKRFAELYKWAEELGMDEIIGPMSFSDLNEEGMLIDGFAQQFFR